MSRAGYDVIDLDDLEALEVGPQVPLWKPLRHRAGIESFGTNAYLGREPGDLVVERHDERRDGHQEMYVVIRGAARFTVADDTFDVPAGGVVALRDPALTREAVATERDTLLLEVGAAPGVAYTASEWEERWLRELGRR
jgi:hypothetical protein